MEQKIGNGNLPINWAVCNLDDILLKISNGANVTQYDEKVGYPISRIETIWNQGIDLDRVKYIKENDADFVEKYSLQHGDVLLSHINSDAHLGKTGVFKNQVKTLIHGINILLIRPVSNINSDFLNFQFNHLRTKGGFVDIAQRSVNQSSVNQRKLKSLQIIVPPLAEQHRIVAKIEELFSELDKGIENLKTARAQLKVYRQALLKHAFEGKLTAEWREQNKDKLETASALQQRIQTERAARYQQQLTDWQATGQKGSKPKAPKPLPPLTNDELADLPELSEGWIYTRFGLVIDEPTYGTSKKCDYEIEGTGVLRIPNVVSGRIDASDLKHAQFTDDEIATYKLNTGDILIIRSNGSVSIVGRCAVVSENDTKFLYAGYLIRLRPNKLLVESRYLLNIFSLHSTRKQIELKAKSTSGVNNINTGEIQSLIISLCGIKEQKVIVEYLEARLSEVDQLDQSITIALQQSEALRQSILKKAFSGALVPQEANDEPASVLLARIKSEQFSNKIRAKS